MMTVEQDMRMSHVYQPLVLLALIEAGGSATLRQLEQRDPGRRDESCPGAPPPLLPLGASRSARAGRRGYGDSRSDVLRVAVSLGMAAGLGTPSARRSARRDTRDLRASRTA
jgi:hypothetical protein